ncbi:flippase activity-associated protein Agl23 [Halobaculum sp. MBLA0147]|uniref:flippase activity-associated protein Agl23 n=1 Tax=Halobaculum sp. MBLA0147 TaxID=3079934 RepID=UPI0035244D27
MTSRFADLRSRVATALQAVDHRYGVSPVVLAVAVVTAASLVVRFAALGNRVAHFDEGRVAYWTLEYARSGEFYYRYIIHGPFVQHVDRVVFQTVGATDVTMRAVTALLGGLLPAAVLLFRDRLRPTETVVAAGFLAFNPVLVYYSRFFRSTILVAGFMFAALGTLLRAHRTGAPRWLYATTALAALGFASKENAVVYLLCYLGAGGLALDYYLRDPNGERRGSAAIRARLGRVRATLGSASGRRWTGYWLGHGALAVGLFAALTLFFYAPRDPNGLGLWSSLASPTRLPALVDATVADLERGLEYWFGHSASEKCYEETLVAGYVCFLERTLGVLGRFAVPLVGFAVGGFLLERYATDRARPLVMVAAYWGFVSVLGYPLGTDIFGAWIVVNALVPLAIPAGVGLAWVLRWGVDAVGESSLRPGTAVVVLLLVVGQVGVTTATAAYQNPAADSNQLVQYAQPADDFRPAIRDLRTVAPHNDGTDVLFYGRELVVEGEGGGPKPVCTVMVRTLPIHWYLQTTAAEAACAYDEAELDDALGSDPPPVVLAHADRRETVAARLDGYDAETYRFRTVGRPVTFFVDRSAVANATAT